MRAIVFDRHGGPDVLEYREDIPIPDPGPGAVRVQVRYAALNRLDDFVRTGWRGLDLAFPHILGADFSGTIVALVSGVTGWAEGQRVVANPTIWCGVCPACVAGQHNRCDHFAILGEHVPGAYAEYVTVPARNLVAIPDDTPDDLAAAAPLVSVTAWHMLVTAGRIRPGETVLVIGAGGGVNTAAIQIAKLAGATVFVIAANAEKAAKACEIGADWVVDRDGRAELGQGGLGGDGPARRRCGGGQRRRGDVGRQPAQPGERRPAADRGRHIRLRSDDPGQLALCQAPEHHRLDDGHASRLRGGDGAGVVGQAEARRSTAPSRWPIIPRPWACMMSGEGFGKFWYRWHKPIRARPARGGVS